MPELKLSRVELKEAIRPFILFQKNAGILPVLDYAIIDTAGSGYKPTIRATDLVFEITTEINPIGDCESFQLLIPFRKVYNFLINSNDSEVLISADFSANRCRVSSGDISMEFNIIDHGNMIKSKPFVRSEGYILPSTSLIDNLKTAARFTSNDELRPSMTCINICQNNGKAFVVSTDAHKLFFRRLKEDYAGYDMLIHRSTGRFVEGVFKKIEPLKISKSTGEISIVGEFSKIIVKEPDEKYPNWAAVLPTDDINEVFVNKKRLQAVLNFLLTVVSRPDRQTRLNFTQESLKINIENTIDSDLLSSEAKLQILKTNQESDFEVGFNCKFLIDAISTSKDAIVKFSHSGMSNKAVVVNNEVLIMPVMLNNYQ